MIVNAYSLFDNKSLTYSPPFYASLDAVAVRMVGDLVADLNTSVGRHPADYVLYRVGMFDDGNGLLQSLDPRAHVSDVIALVPRPAAPDFFTRSGDVLGPNGTTKS